MLLSSLQSQASLPAHTVNSAKTDKPWPIYSNWNISIWLHQRKCKYRTKQAENINITRILTIQSTQGTKRKRGSFPKLQTNDIWDTYAHIVQSYLNYVSKKMATTYQLFNQQKKKMYSFQIVIIMLKIILNIINDHLTVKSIVLCLFLFSLTSL